MTGFKKILLVTVVSGLFLPLMGCLHKNPMLNDETINEMKGRFFLNSSQFPIQECAAYYSGLGNVNSQTKCDSWSTSYFKSLQRTGSLPPSAILEDFRDTQFWKIVKAQ